MEHDVENPVETCPMRLSKLACVIDGHARRMISLHASKKRAHATGTKVTMTQNRHLPKLRWKLQTS